jgi:hypothetical protein
LNTGVDGILLGNDSVYKEAPVENPAAGQYASGRKRFSLGMLLKFSCVLFSIGLCQYIPSIDISLLKNI